MFDDSCSKVSSEEKLLNRKGFKVPNLFIIGAPKCGTTAMAQWLGEHKNVYMPKTKEPHHFSSEYSLTSNTMEYANIYRGWSEEAWAIDASVWYLYSPNAVSNILRERKDARFIVMVRNPLQMIPSMHSQQIFNGNELESDLSKALKLNDIRLQGKEARVRSGYPSDHLAYYHSCALGWQLERFMATVKESQRHVILYDDFAASPERELRSVYDFIGLEPVMPLSFSRVNAAKIRRFPKLDHIVKSLGDWKHSHGIQFRIGFLSWLRKVNRLKKTVDPLDDEIMHKIQSRLEEDVRRLEQCLGRDLSHWLFANRNAK
jgi:hypothetical protein